MSEFDSSYMKAKNVCGEDYVEVHNSKLGSENNNLTDAAVERSPRAIPVIKITSDMESPVFQDLDFDKNQGESETQEESESLVTDNVSDVTRTEQTTQEVVSDDKSEKSRSLDDDSNNSGSACVKTSEELDSFVGEKRFSEIAREEQIDGVDLSGDTSMNFEVNSPVEIYSDQQRKVLQSDRVEDDLHKAMEKDSGQIVDKAENEDDEVDTASANSEDIKEKIVRKDSGSVATGDFDSNNKVSHLKETRSKGAILQKLKDEKASFENLQEMKYSSGEDIFLDGAREDFERIDHNSNLFSMEYLEKEKRLFDDNRSEIGLEKLKKYEESATFPQLTMPCPRTETVGFLEEEDVLRIFQDLASQIVYERPSNPFEFMIEKLEDMKVQEEQNASKKRRRRSRQSIPKK